VSTEPKEKCSSALKIFKCHHRQHPVAMLIHLPLPSPIQPSKTLPHPSIILLSAATTVVSHMSPTRTFLVFAPARCCRHDLLPVSGFPLRTPALSCRPCMVACSLNLLHFPQFPTPTFLVLPLTWCCRRNLPSLPLLTSTSRTLSFLSPRTVTCDIFFIPWLVSWFCTLHYFIAYCMLWLDDIFLNIMML
jgi:hypothetical protein